MQELFRFLLEVVPDEHVEIVGVVLGTVLHIGLVEGGSNRLHQN